MKKLLAIIILNLCFIIPSQANDIRDFQIEGISIGDSLLDYFNEDIIKENKENIYDWVEKIRINFQYQKLWIIKNFCLMMLCNLCIKQMIRNTPFMLCLE